MDRSNPTYPKRIQNYIFISTHLTNKSFQIKSNLMTQVRN